MEDIVRNNRLSSYYIWISILLGTIVLGVYAVLASFIEGMEILEFNLLIPWSMLISTYVFFVVSSTGLCIITSLGHVFGAKRFEMIGKRGVFLAIITIVFGMIAIMLHLGHPERSAVYVWITPNIRSAIWGMGFFYSFYILFIIVEYWLLAREELAKTANASTGWKQVFYGLATFGIKSESEESVKGSPVCTDSRYSCAYSRTGCSQHPRSCVRPCRVKGILVWRILSDLFSFVRHILGSCMAAAYDYCHL